MCASSPLFVQTKQRKKEWRRAICIICSWYAAYLLTEIDDAEEYIGNSIVDSTNKNSSETMWTD